MSSQPGTSQTHVSGELQLMLPSPQPGASTVAHFPSPAPISSQPDSLQVNVSSISHLGPSSSQIDTSFATDKSHSEVSEREKAQWREYVDPVEFFNFTGWDRSNLGFFLHEFDAYAKIGYSFPDSLLPRAQRDMTSL